jgi:hypothetical protein
MQGLQWTGVPQVLAKAQGTLKDKPSLLGLQREATHSCTGLLQRCSGTARLCSKRESVHSSGLARVS